MRLLERDYAPGDADAAEALVQEALLRLTARRGSFPFLPELGSRMHLLAREKPSAWPALAVQFAAEALDGMEGVTVTGAQVSRTQDGLSVAAELLWQGETLTVTAQLEG